MSEILENFMLSVITSSPVWDNVETARARGSQLPYPSVSIIVATLNEAENIEQTLRDIVEHASGCLDFEIIVTDGGSTDGTCEKVACYRSTSKHPVSLVRNRGGGGLARDVLAAASRARFPILVVLDADGSHPAAAIPALVEPIAEDRCDMVIGSRYVEGGSTAGWPFRRRALSRLGAALASPFTDVADPMSGFFAIGRERLLAAGEQAEGFKIGLEALHAGGDDLRVGEVPIAFSDRMRGTSKIGASQFRAYLGQLVRFSRGTTSSDAIERFVVVGIVGFFLDFTVVSALWALGADVMVAHICGFCVATAFNYMGHALWSFEGRPREHAQIARFVVLSILALAMRGGFIAAASGPLGLPFSWAAIAGIGGGGIVSYLGNEFYVFRGSARLAPTTQWKLAAIAIAAYAVLLRIVYQGDMDLIPQEAYYWNYAQHPALGYLDHPPMVSWVIWVGTSLFGNTEFGVRIGATACWLATAFFVFCLSRNLFGRTQAFLAVMLLSVLPFYFLIGVLMTPDAPLTAAWAGALYFLERATIGNRKTAWLGAGVCVGVGMVSKYTIALLGPAALVFLILDPASRRWFRTIWPYLAACLAAILFSPVVVWNAVNDWASFTFQGSRRWLADDIKFSTHILIACIAAVIGPVGLLLAGSAAGRIIRVPGKSDMRSRAAFIIVFTLVPLSVFAAFSLFREVKLNWTGPVWLALLPAMADVLTRAIRDQNSGRFVAALRAGIAVSLLAFALLFHYLAIGLPFVGYPGGVRGLPVAWTEFGAEARKIKSHVQARTGYTPLLVGMDTYNIASELGFYAGGPAELRNITSRNIFGKGGLMYGVWGASLPSERNVVVMYALKEGQISSADLPGWFERIEPVQKQVLWKHDAVAGQFFYRVGYGFRRPD
jgi:dolichol-phosphate mannosyltransferase